MERVTTNRRRPVYWLEAPREIRGVGAGAWRIRPEPPDLERIGIRDGIDRNDRPEVRHAKAGYEGINVGIDIEQGAGVIEASGRAREQFTGTGVP